MSILEKQSFTVHCKAETSGGGLVYQVGPATHPCWTHGHTYRHTVSYTYKYTHTCTRTHTHTHTHTPIIHPCCLHSTILVEQGSGTGQGEVGCDVGSVARSLRTEMLMIEKTLAMTCSVAM